MACSSLIFGILLVPLLGLGGAQEPCPTSCRCSLEILNCSRITDPPGFHRVPLPQPAAHPHPFTYLDFTGNAISSIGKEVWNAYPWTEYLFLKDNHLTRLQNSSLEGLLSLTYLDVSCNKIQTIEMEAFEAVPFLQIINLSGNLIERIMEGTFRAWHGMQFLLQVDLSHNPLAVIQDSYFFRLPSLKLLDLGATEVTPAILEELLLTSLKLRTLILPKKMSCCLCHLKEDLEVLQETLRLECTGSCKINATWCEKEEPLNRLQEEVMKILEIRKWNGSSLLTILPERARPKNDTPERAKPDNDTLAWIKNYFTLAANLNLLKSVKRLMQLKADEPLDVNWADKRELEKLYLLASLLQAALKEKIVELDKVSPEATVQNDQVLENPTNEAIRRSAGASFKKERHVRQVTREDLLGRNQRQKDILFRFRRDGRQVAKTATQSADKPSVFELHDKAESERKLMEGLDPQRVLPFLRSPQVALESIADSLTNAIKPTDSTAVDNDDNDLTSPSGGDNSVAVPRKVLGSQILTKEELLNALLHSSDNLAGGGTPETSAGVTEPSSNELSPEITLSRGTYWDHQRTSVSPLLGFLAPQDDDWIQDEFFETERNEKLPSFIPNTPVRKLISHVIPILKMDCATPTHQMACVKLISRTGLLMKLLSDNDETSSLGKSYFWPPMNLENMIKASSKTLEKSSGEIASEGIRIPMYGIKLLCAVLVIAVILNIIAPVCMVVIYILQRRASSAKDRTFLGRGKEPLPYEELPRTPPLWMDNKPLQLKDMFYIQDETQRNNMVKKLHHEESLEEMDMVGWSNTKSSLPESTAEKPLSVPIPPTPPPPSPSPPPPPPSPPPSTPQKSSVEKSSDTAEGTSEATNAKAASSATDEGEGEDKEFC